VRQELGQVDVNNGAQHYYVLILIWILELQVTGGGEHRLDGPHAVVVVELTGELFGAQSVRGHDLDREWAGIDEAERVEGNLGNDGVVGNHHGHGSEQSLQVVWQLGSARVAGVHCDECGACWIQADLGT